jgi:phenylalanyl-tRNA synthetase beta chain
MKVPISWLKDFVDITMSIEELAERLTLAGLEVGGIQYLGLPGADLEWDRDLLVLGHLLKVEPHPDADRLVLATVDIGRGEPETVVTGAPNLFQYRGRGDLRKLGLKSPFVMEGATVYDGHSEEPGKKMKLKGRAIRGIMNRHMLCSEKELGLSDDHGGIILTDSESAPPGTPLVDVWGDAVLDIDLTPNLIRCANILGVAREVAALTGQKLRYPDTTLPAAEGVPLSDQLIIETTEPDLNPRFVAILIKGIEVKPSPYWLQRRLRLAGQRPINNIVDVSNYVMLEIGQPNHAFDWDVLRRRALEYASPPAPPKGGEINEVPSAGGLGGTTNEPKVKIITRLAEPGESILTLDGKTHRLPDFSILVTDPKSNLSIGGIMGGGESEVSETSRNILLEAAAWNFINIRRTSQALGIYSEAAYRFSRGIHPAQALLGARRGAKLMAELAGGTLAPGVLDYYPKPADEVIIDLPQAEVTRLLGLELSVGEIKTILESLEFSVEVINHPSPGVRVTVPDHRLDIGDEPTTGQADLVEEIARIYGYDRLPVTEIADELPPQRNNTGLSREERTRDLLVQCGLQEVITYRLTTRQAEARVLGRDYVAQAGYITLANPSTPERSVMRHSVLNSVLEAAAENTKNSERVQLFEVGQIYIFGRASFASEDAHSSENKQGVAEGNALGYPGFSFSVSSQQGLSDSSVIARREASSDADAVADEDGILPHEPRRLVMVMTGPREAGGWLPADPTPVDFYDLKGVVESLLAGLHVGTVSYKPAKHPAFYPGRTTEVEVNGALLGLLGQLHPRLIEAYDLKVGDDQAVLAADFDLEALLAHVPDGHVVRSVPRYPPVQQDIALIVDETVPADRVESLILQSGQPLVTSATLFDVFRGEQIGAGKKSLAYSLTFQSEESTLTDKVVAKQQAKIIKRVESELGAKLRG